MKLGEDVPEAQLNAMIDSLRANECCTLIYTSGTTGNPKGVMLSHDNVSCLDTFLKLMLCVWCEQLPCGFVLYKLKKDIWIKTLR